MKNVFQYRILYLAFFLLFGANATAQEIEDYRLGDEDVLQIVVYVFGEVGQPNKYHVTENTDVVELMSIAGGSTEFSNLSKVTITRHKPAYLANLDNDTPLPNGNVEKEIITFNIKDYLKNKTGPAPPKLQAGDVIYVHNNKWRTWRTASTIIRDLAFVAGVYISYLRWIK